MRLVILGLGYSGQVIAARLRAAGWHVAGTSRDGRGGTIRFDDYPAVKTAIGRATHLLSTIPPDADHADVAADPVIAAYRALLDPRDRWLGYLSSTGVYGDIGGAWVDESAPLRGRRGARNAADAAWLDLGASCFRLPGIYGPGRSVIDRLRAGAAHRVGLPGQVFSRIHVDDLAAGVIAGFGAPSGVYNLADDAPAAQDDVVAFAARLIGVEPPPIIALAELSPAARAFYAENRRVANGKAKRLLGWTARYRDYRAGLRAINATSSPIAASAAPAAASTVQR